MKTSFKNQKLSTFSTVLMRVKITKTKTKTKSNRSPMLVHDRQYKFSIMVIKQNTPQQVYNYNSLSCVRIYSQTFHFIFECFTFNSHLRIALALK